MQGSSRASLVTARELLEAATSARRVRARGAGRRPVRRGCAARLPGLAAARADRPRPRRRGPDGRADRPAHRQAQPRVGVAGGTAGRPALVRAGDLADALELLAVDALVIAAEQDGVLGSLEDELFRFERTVDGAPELRDALSDRRADPQAKAELISDLLRGKATDATVRLARQAVLHPRGRRLTSTLELYLAEAAARREQTVAHATVAAPLSAKQQDRLVAALSAMMGRPVQLNVDVDPAVMGGLRVEIGDEVIDGTISGRLDEARRRLAG